MSTMETRVAMIAIVVEKQEMAPQVNQLLHTYRQYIIGRMGIPYEKKGIALISIALDAPQNEISALSGKLGNIGGISAKVVYSKSAG